MKLEFWFAIVIANIHIASDKEYSDFWAIFYIAFAICVFVLSRNLAWSEHGRELK